MQKIKPTSIINEDAERMICVSKGLIDDQGNLTDKAITIVNEFETFLVKTKKKTTDAVLGPDSMENVKVYRELFPAIRLPSKELARQSVRELQDKFIWFFKTYPEYDWKIVLDAAHYYIWEYSQTAYMYMNSSSYFIKKMDIKTKKDVSKLADYCQFLLDNPDI